MLLLLGFYMKAILRYYGYEYLMVVSYLITAAVWYI